MAERANNVVEANALIKLTTNQSSEIGKMIALTSKSDVIFSTVKIIFLLDYPKNNMISIYVTMKKIKEEYPTRNLKLILIVEYLKCTLQFCRNQHHQMRSLTNITYFKEPANVIKRDDKEVDWMPGIPLKSKLSIVSKIIKPPPVAPNKPKPETHGESRWARRSHTTRRNSTRTPPQDDPSL